MKDFDQYAELTAKYLARESTLAEKEALFAWIEKDPGNRQFFEGLEEVWNMAEDAETASFDTNMAAAWAKIDQATTPQPARLTTGQQPARIIPLKSKSQSFWRIAAALLLLAALGLWWRTGQAPASPATVEFVTLPGEKKEIALPDGSMVVLNGNSRISYLENFTQRNINLEGEAFFEVKRMEESPFVISSGEALTTVLGTSFNVRAYPEEEKIEVTVVTGKVALSVAKQNAQPVELPAGTSGIVHRKEEKAERVEEEIQNALSWKTLKLDFEEDLMRDVITTLERYFGTDIKVSNESIYDCRFTSPFDQPTLDEILEVVSATVGVQITKDGNDYTLTGNGCLPDN